MPDGFQRYKKAVRRHLRCSRAAKDGLLARLEQFRQDARDGAEAYPYEQAVADFGPPEAMAQTLMEEVSQEEARAYQRSRRCLFAAGMIAGVLWILFTWYIYFMKTIPIVEYREIVTSTAIETTNGADFE